MREYSIRVTGPHCGTITIAGFTYAEAEAEVARLIQDNRHARTVEIIHS